MTVFQESLNVQLPLEILSHTNFSQITMVVLGTTLILFSHMVMDSLVVSFINGPATAKNYVPAQSLWNKAKTATPPTLITGLMNSTNTYNGAGKNFETTSTP
ncbi:hypothetical protein OCU04_000459 [Sclerotinia nivalis]|uniref:Uncharacterized protein n=1 Tax=Sclerotinia nivalis TaxID=352851 RepID=A0A9X0AW36_9HELO|nr:hypothetical protein OCU04_000459 [Sclerotinia nivalis]